MAPVTSNAQCVMDNVTQVERCPVCAGQVAMLDVVDFNESCAEWSGKFSPLSGVAICCFLYQRSGFCFAPEMHRWKPEEFAKKVYNGEYIMADPDWIRKRGVQSC